MSLWKFNDFEAEIDLTDADFYDKLESAQTQMESDSRNVPVTGKKSDIIFAQVKCFWNFFDTILYQGAGKEITCGRKSLELCIQASESLEQFMKKEDERIDSAYGKYTPRQGNRQQRRQYNKGNHYNNGQKKGGRY